MAIRSPYYLWPENVSLDYPSPIHHGLAMCSDEHIGMETRRSPQLTDVFSGSDVPMLSEADLSPIAPIHGDRVVLGLKKRLFV